ncbi:MAG: hypothetical protein HND47_19865 [Chloroflexi bacterium]|nr:hypothetical protein [Chloroflexota bacterium]
MHRMRAHGKTVIGMGVSGTSADYLVSACDKFVFYDKWQGVNKVRKQTPTNGGQNYQAAKQSQPPAQKQAQPPPAKTTSAAPAPIPPEKRLERYLGILTANKIRMTPDPQRPLVIYKIYDIVKANPDLTFNQLKELAQSYFANAVPKIEPQLVTDTVHQLFHTFCFEFDADSSERIMNRRMRLPADVASPSDLLNKCDQKMIQLIIADLGASEALDKEIAAQILYGGVRNPKALDHIQELIEAGNQA